MRTRLFRRVITASLAVQFTAGKLSMVFSAITVSTVLSMKFHVCVVYTFLGCVAVVLAVALFFVRSGWFRSELRRVNELNGLKETIK